MISVVVPALNEELAISDTVKSIASVLEANRLVPFEIIIVDDGSSDGTATLALEAGARVISHPHNVGYGRSIKDGIVAAKFETIVITDADGTYPIGDIPKLVDRHAVGFDMTVGARQGEHHRESIIKMPLRWILRKLVEFTAGRHIPDINSGLRVFDRSTALLYLNALCDTFSFTTSMTLSYMMTGRFVTYCPIDYHKRIGKSKVRLLSDSIRTFQYILEAAIYFNPLRMFILASGLLVLAAVVCFLAAYALQFNVFYYSGLGALIASAIVLPMGLLAVLLRQILVHSDAGRAMFVPRKPIERQLAKSAEQASVRASTQAQADKVHS